MLDRLPELAAADPELLRRGRHIHATCLVGIGGQDWLVHVRDGQVSVERGPFVGRSWRFALRGTADAWNSLWQAVPPPQGNDVFALVKHGRLTVEGDLQPFFANLLYFKRLLALPRPAAGDAPPSLPQPVGAPRWEPVVGRYLHLDIGGVPHRLYVEQAGPEDGIPLLCLHTAGADGRQWRGLLNDPEITARFRVIAFDMPWHGKSSPPAGWETQEYRLTTRAYTGMVLDVAQALRLDRPVAIGCSIGGRIVLHLALDHPEAFRAVIGLQSGAHVQRYYDLDWLHRGDVHGGEVAAGIVSGLVAPQSPPADRAETLWHYMQGGPGVFKGDLFFYTLDGDIRDRIGRIDTARCPLHMLTGDYDYSASPADAKAVAELVPGAELTIMPGLGHFPMSENPALFLKHLRPVLAEIERASAPTVTAAAPSS